MSPTLTTFLFEAANFLVLAGALGWLFFKPIRQAVDDRRSRLEAEAQAAAQKLEEAQRAKEEIEATRAKLQEELSELRSHEKEAARRQAEQVLADARQAAQQMLDQARLEAVKLSATQRDRLARAAAIAAAEVVSRLLTEIDSGNLQSALVDAACRQLRELPAESVAPVKIESAAPLSSAQQAALREALGPAASDAEFKTAENLLGGVRISTGGGLIDASIDGLQSFARRALAKEMELRTQPSQLARGAHDG